MQQKVCIVSLIIIEPSEVQVSTHSLGACHGSNIQALIILMMSSGTSLCIKLSFLILNNIHSFFFKKREKKLTKYSAIHNILCVIFIISPFDLHIMFMAGLS